MHTHTTIIISCVVCYLSACSDRKLTVGEDTILQLLTYIRATIIGEVTGRLFRLSIRQPIAGGDARAWTRAKVACSADGGDGTKLATVIVSRR